MLLQKGRRRRRINGDTLACEWGPPFNNPIAIQYPMFVSTLTTKTLFTKKNLQ